MKKTKKMLCIALALTALLALAIPAMAQGRGGMEANNRGGVRGGMQMPGAGLKGGRGAMLTRPNGQQPDGETSATPNAQLPDQQAGLGRGLGKVKGGRGRMGGGRGMIGLEQMLRDGAISEETYNKIRESRLMKGYDALLENGTLTQEEYDSIEKYLKDKLPKAPEAAEEPDVQPEGGLDPELSALVESGVITEEQAKAIMDARSQAPETPAAADADDSAAEA